MGSGLRKPSEQCPNLDVKKQLLIWKNAILLAGWSPVVDFIKKKIGNFPTFGNKLVRLEKSQNLSVFVYSFIFGT